MLLLLSLACFAQSQPAAEPEPVSYAERVDALEQQREALAARWRQGDAAALDAAQQVALDGITEGLIPTWLGTPWAFYGDTTTPQEGEIACGYFVSTVLEHAGFQVERVRMAQQPSERIIQSLTPETSIWRYSDQPIEVVLQRLRQEGDGLYVVGLDFHTGFLVQRGAETTFCHASYLGPVAVVCEPAETSAALESRYRVVGRLLEDEMVTRWLEGRPFPTRT